MEENEVQGGNHWTTQVTVKFYHIMLPWAGFELTTSVVIGATCTGSCKSIYHAITTTTDPGKQHTFVVQLFYIVNVIYWQLMWYTLTKVSLTFTSLSLVLLLTTVLPVLFKYCYKYCYSDSRRLWAVMKGGGLAL